VVDVIDFHLRPEDAVNVPKFHHQWLPDEVDLERGFPDSTATSLAGMGYTLKHWGRIGATEVILIQPDGTYKGVADGRGDDAAAGY
jgi:gamma-glutamyltranspeptidase/glutathione hydrolase